MNGGKQATGQDDCTQRGVRLPEPSLNEPSEQEFLAGADKQERERHEQEEDQWILLSEFDDLVLRGFDSQIRKKGRRSDQQQQQRHHTDDGDGKVTPGGDPNPDKLPSDSPEVEISECDTPERDTL